MGLDHELTWPLSLERTLYSIELPLAIAGAFVMVNWPRSVGVVFFFEFILLCCTSKERHCIDMSSEW